MTGEEWPDDEDTPDWTAADTRQAGRDALAMLTSYLLRREHDDSREVTKELLKEIATDPVRAGGAILALLGVVEGTLGRICPPSNPERLEEFLAEMARRFMGDGLA